MDLLVGSMMLLCAGVLTFALGFLLAARQLTELRSSAAKASKKQTLSPFTPGPVSSVPSTTSDAALTTLIDCSPATDKTKIPLASADHDMMVVSTYVSGQPDATTKSRDTTTEDRTVDSTPNEPSTKRQTDTQAEVVCDQAALKEWMVSDDDNGWAVEGDDYTPAPVMVDNAATGPFTPPDDIYDPHADESDGPILVEDSMPLLEFLAGPGDQCIAHLAKIFREDAAKRIMNEQLCQLIKKGIISLQTRHLGRQMTIGERGWKYGGFSERDASCTAAIRFPTRTITVPHLMYRKHGINVYEDLPCVRGLGGFIRKSDKRHAYKFPLELINVIFHVDAKVTRETYAYHWKPNLSDSQQATTTTASRHNPNSDKPSKPRQHPREYVSHQRDRASKSNEINSPPRPFGGNGFGTRRQSPPSFRPNRSAFGSSRQNVPSEANQHHRPGQGFGSEKTSNYRQQIGGFRSAGGFGFRR